MPDVQLKSTFRAPKFRERWELARKSSWELGVEDRELGVELGLKGRDAVMYDLRPRPRPEAVV